MSDGQRISNNKNVKICRCVCKWCFKCVDEKIRYESQVLAIQKGEGDSEKMQKLQQLYTILVENKDIKEYFDLEVKFNVMVADVNKIIAEAIKDVL